MTTQTIPTTMDAVRLLGEGGPEKLALERIRTPEPGPGQALVRVHAAAITRDELEWPVDRLPATPSYELSGVVAAVGPDVEDVAPGDEVYALSPFDRDGAAATYALVPADVLAPKPATLGHIESAAIPLAGLSAWQALLEHGRLEAGERVLVLGAAGGVGSFAVQVARSRGAHVVAVASPENLEAARALGADEVVDHAGAAGVEPVDLLFDTSGGERLAGALPALRQGGRLVSVATEPPETPGITATFFIVEPSRDQLVELARLADAGALRPAIDAVFPLADARAAFERSLGAGRRGKIVLEVE
jgi:NADPH:quinone reductase-like Zn-dependent oxidoreductase